MVEISLLIKNSPYWMLPDDLLGWLGLLILLGLTIAMLWIFRQYNQPVTKQNRILLWVLISLSPVTTLLFPSIYSNSTLAFSAAGTTGLSSEVPVVLFGSVSWILAAGIFGPLAGAGLAFFSGVLISLWGTHNPFLGLELAFIGVWMGILLNQRYRTPLFRVLRHPLISSLFLAAIYPLLYFIDSMLFSPGSLANRLELTLLHLVPAWISLGITLLIGGLCAEIFRYFVPNWWGTRQTNLPSPSEGGLAARFIFSLVPIGFIMLVFLIVGDWIVANRVARDIVSGQMRNAADSAAQSVPFFLEQGQNLFIQLTRDPGFAELPPDELEQKLADDMRQFPYFSQLIFLDTEGDLVASHPANAASAPVLSGDEMAGITLADRIPIQTLTIAPVPGGPAAYLSFISVVKNTEGEIQGILVARSDLSTNVFAKPVLTSIDSVQDLGGEGTLLDDTGRILYDPDPERIMTEYSGETADTAFFSESSAADGTRQMIYFQPIAGKNWAVVLTVPARYAQEQALNIAVPLLAILVVLSIVAVVSFRFGIRRVTSSLHDLTHEADRMAHGQLEQPLPIRGNDEVGQLSRTFEQLRASLKSRLDELNRLLYVSQGVASTLDIKDSLRPVLESAVVIGASSARIFLVPEVVPELERDPAQMQRFGFGQSAASYAYLDDQLLTLTRQQDILKLTNLRHPRLLTFPPEAAKPQAILAVALRHENLFYGVLWVAFDNPHQFSDEEVNYLTTLASQAAIAIANTRLFLTAEVGRQRLESILTSSPDPILVTDQQNHLLLTNPAACRILHFEESTSLGKPVREVINNPALINLLVASSNEDQSIELNLGNEHTYQATASSVMAEGKPVGRVCVLRDVTSFKELDNLKSDFVSTVSHDLRAPLSLIRGYASMLMMVGELNEQQNSYLRRIITGVDDMSDLVSGLLDIGRIEAGVGLQLQKRPADEVIERVIKSVQEKAQQRHIQIVKDLDTTVVPLLEADQGLLQRALANLVDNAIKFTDSGGKVTLGLRVEPEQVVYTVQDSGIGISPADQRRLFEKFYRVSAHGTKAERGSGLGLAISKSIVDRHHGTIKVNSQLGKGSIFEIAIPLKQS